MGFPEIGLAHDPKIEIWKKYRISFPEICLDPEKSNFGFFWMCFPGFHENKITALKIHENIPIKENGTSSKSAIQCQTCLQLLNKIKLYTQPQARNQLYRL